MAIIYPDNHPKSGRSVWYIDVKGMDQATIDDFLDEIKKYFDNAEIVDGQIVYSGAKFLPYSAIFV